MAVDHFIFLLDLEARNGESLVLLKTLTQLADHAPYRFVEIAPMQGASYPIINLRVNPSDKPTLLPKLEFRPLKEDYEQTCKQTGQRDPRVDRLIALIDPLIEEDEKETRRRRRF